MPPHPFRGKCLHRLRLYSNFCSQ
jgi:Ras-related protein Rab-1A